MPSALRSSFSASQTLILGCIKGAGAATELIFTLVLVGSMSTTLTHSPAVLWTVYVILLSIGRAGSDLKLLEQTSKLTTASVGQICRYSIRYSQRYVLLSVLLCSLVLILTALLDSNFAISGLLLLGAPFHVTVTIFSDSLRAAGRLYLSAVISSLLVYGAPVCAIALASVLGKGLTFEQIFLVYLLNIACLVLAIIVLALAKTTHTHINFSRSHSLAHELLQSKTLIRVIALVGANLPFWISAFYLTTQELTGVYQAFRIASILLLVLYVIDTPLYPKLSLHFQTNPENISEARIIAANYTIKGTTMALAFSALIVSGLPVLDFLLSVTSKTSDLLYTPQSVVYFCAFYIISVYIAPESALQITSENAKYVLRSYILGYAFATSAMLFPPPGVEYLTWFPVCLISAVLIRVIYLKLIRSHATASI